MWIRRSGSCAPLATLGLLAAGGALALAGCGDDDSTGMSVSHDTGMRF
jgi:hypothetical protein